ncbi:MAG: SRPBCC domain-containing protein [Flavobacteriales bacterium]|nr:SRPBCC domain-containing protein [Flavobacteriales bacterium]
MKDFDWTRFTVKIAVKADQRTVYDAWTSSAAIERWFLSKAVFRNDAGADLAPTEGVGPGCTYAWNWYGFDVTEQGRILGANGKDLFRFTFAGACPVEVRLTKEHDHTVVTLTQSEIPEDDASKRSIRLGCHTGWSFFLLNLKSVLEGGLDLRNKNAAFTGVVNA